MIVAFDPDLQILLKIDLEKIPIFLHECIDELYASHRPDTDLYSNDIELPRDEFIKVKTSVQSFYKKCVLNGTVELRNELPDTINHALKTCFSIRQKDISNALIKDVLLRNGHNIVENIDWRLKWVMGTSKLASHREPILQIDLNCRKHDGVTEQNTINFETTLDQVDCLINELSKVRSELQETKL